MRRSIFVFSVFIITALLLYPEATVSFSTGSPGGKTGSPLDNTDCTSCHGVISTSSALTSISSNIPSSGYVPGNTYTITATINPTSIVSGFEITSEENLTNTKTGTFFITNSTTTQLTNNGSAVTHTAAGGNALNSWSFDWQAPVAGTGDITFYGAFIEAGYPFGQNFDDYFSATTLIISEFIAPVPYDCTDSLEVTDVIIDNSNLTMNIAIYNGYNYFLNYPYVAFTIDANGDTIQSGNMNLFVAFSLDTTWYNYTLSSTSPTSPISMYFVYSDGSLVTDTCILTYNLTPTVITDISVSGKRNRINIIDILGRESKQARNDLRFYIYDDGTVEKRIVVE